MKALVMRMWKATFSNDNDTVFFMMTWSTGHTHNDKINVDNDMANRPHSLTMNIKNDDTVLVIWPQTQM